MHLMINGQMQAFIPIKTFREQQHLPDTFSISLFEPKDFTGLAAIDKAGSEMNELRQGILESVPQALLLPDLLQIADTLQAMFRAGLYGINEAIGLKSVEVEYAVAGFGDVLCNWCYVLIAALQSKTDPPSFMKIYGEWFESSLRLSRQIHTYNHDGLAWQVQVINHAYGRGGLRVAASDAVYYVQDGVYACPAEGYMVTLLTDVARQISDAINLHP